MLDATAVLGDDGAVTLFAVNRDMGEPIELTADLRAFGELSVREHIVLRHDDVKAVNTETAPDNVRPAKGPGGSLSNGKLTATLPALSWNVLRLQGGR